MGRDSVVKVVVVKSPQLALPCSTPQATSPQAQCLQRFSPPHRSNPQATSPQAQSPQLALPQFFLLLPFGLLRNSGVEQIDVLRQKFEVWSEERGEVE